MRKILFFTIFLITLSFFACRQPKGICSLALPSYEGPGLESKLKQFEYVGIMDTVAALIKLDITSLSLQKKHAPVIGGNILIRKPGEKEIFYGTVSNVKGKSEFFIDSGTYDFEFSYYGCNTLLVENAELMSGGMYEVEVELGIQGKERKTFEVDLATKQDDN